MPAGNGVMLTTELAPSAALPSVLTAGGTQPLEGFQGLPFVRGRDFWDVTPTGHWSEDNKLGRDYASAALAYMTENDSPNLMSSIVQAMVGHGEWSGIETGFMTLVGVRAIH